MVCSILHIFITILILFKMHSSLVNIFLAVFFIVRTAFLVEASQPVLYTCYDSACSNCTATQNLTNSCLNSTVPFPIQVKYSSYFLYCQPMTADSTTFYTDTACQVQVPLSSNFFDGACVYDSAAAVDVSLQCGASFSDFTAKANTYCLEKLNTATSPPFTAGKCSLSNPGDFIYTPPPAYSVDCQSETLYWYQDSACTIVNNNTIPLPTCLPGVNGGGIYYSIKCSSSQSFVQRTTAPQTNPPSQPSGAMLSKAWFSIFSILSTLFFVWL